MGILNDLLPRVSITPNINTGSSVGGTGYNSGVSNAIDPQLVIFNLSVIIVWVLGIAAVLTFLWAGFNYITAGDNADKAESAKKIIIGSIVGMLLIVFSYLIFNITTETLVPPSGNTIDEQGARDLIRKPFR